MNSPPGRGERLSLARTIRGLAERVVGNRPHHEHTSEHLAGAETPTNRRVKTTGRRVLPGGQKTASTYRCLEKRTGTERCSEEERREQQGI